MTLEGDYSAHREGGGQAYVCRDREQAIAWMKKRRVDDRQDIVGPWKALIHVAHKKKANKNSKAKLIVY